MEGDTRSSVARLPNHLPHGGERGQEKRRPGCLHGQTAGASSAPNQSGCRSNRKNQQDLLWPRTRDCRLTLMSNTLLASFTPTNSPETLDAQHEAGYALNTPVRLSADSLVRLAWFARIQDSTGYIDSRWQGRIRPRRFDTVLAWIHTLADPFGAATITHNAVPPHGRRHRDLPSFL